MEADDAVRVAGAGNGYRLIYELCDSACVEGRGDYAGALAALQPLLPGLRLAEDDAAYADVERTLYHLRLIAAQHNAVGVGKQRGGAALRQCDDDVAGNGIHKLRSIV